MRRVLQLNTTWEPMKFISDVDALYLVRKGRAKIVHNMDGQLSVWSDLTYSSAHETYAVPATIVLVGARVTHRPRRPRFRKKVLFNRDRWRCGYCDKKLSTRTATIDHVYPESRGGRLTWENCVTACSACNRRKANKTLEEAGMKLLKRPGPPSSLDFWDITKSDDWHSDWSVFIHHNE